MYFSNGDKYDGSSPKHKLSNEGSGNLVKETEKEQLSSLMGRNTQATGKTMKWKEGGQ